MQVPQPLDALSAYHAAVQAQAQANAALVTATPQERDALERVAQAATEAVDFARTCVEAERQERRTCAEAERQERRLEQAYAAQTLAITALAESSPENRVALTANLQAATGLVATLNSHTESGGGRALFSHFFMALWGFRHLLKIRNDTRELAAKHPNVWKCLKVFGAAVLSALSNGPAQEQELSIAKYVWAGVQVLFFAILSEDNLAIIFISLWFEGNFTWIFAPGSDEHKSFKTQ